MKMSQETRRKISAKTKESWRSGTRKRSEETQGNFREMPMDDYWKMMMSKWTNKSN
jgi:hypothetical protein